MYPSADAHQLSILLRISSELDIVGDVTATVDSPADLLAWATTLPDPVIGAWRTRAGSRFVQVTAPHNRFPVHGRITAVLACDQHTRFWNELPTASALEPGTEHALEVKDLSHAWEAMPLVADT
jgi:hypothetical protein